MTFVALVTKKHDGIKHDFMFGKCGNLLSGGAGAFGWPVALPILTAWNMCFVIQTWFLVSPHRSPNMLVKKSNKSVCALLFVCVTNNQQRLIKGLVTSAKSIGLFKASAGPQ